MNPHVRAAAAEICVHMLANLSVCRRAVCGQERVRAHDHAGDAIAALGSLLLDEGALQRARRVFRPEPLECGDLAPLQNGDGRQAREDRLAVDNDGASAALAEATAEFRAVEFERAA